jgi:DnaK suppressor protein
MVQFETEAREFLLRRRHRLTRWAEVPRPPSPSPHWLDLEAMPVPADEAARRELAEIEAALLRIDAGRYGTCESCGGPMGLQRMRAIPEARYCVGCSGQDLAAE